VHAGARLFTAPPGFNFWSFPMSALFDATALVVPFENLRMTDVEAVGGKNASLGEMISQLPQGVRVPTGFATTAHAFRNF
jgi:pyruvate,water dikinase